MRGKGFLIIVLLGGIGGLGYRYLPSYYNPFAPLQLADPPGWITTFKLQRLTPSQCRELLTAANQQGLISSQPVADSAGECPLSHVVRVRDFGLVKLSSSFLASCPLEIGRAGAALRAVCRTAGKTFNRNVDEAPPDPHRTSG